MNCVGGGETVKVIRVECYVITELIWLELLAK